MWIYTITDWLGAVPILVCLGFAVFGLVLLIRNRSLKLVDTDILLLGVYYAVVIGAYVFFEKFPINYRPVLIEGELESSYPSSTTLLVLSVMPTLKYQIDRRSQKFAVRLLTALFVILFSAFMVIGRTISGVHWLTDILGSILLSAGLFQLYRGAVGLFEERERKTKSKTRAALYR